MENRIAFQYDQFFPNLPFMLPHLNNISLYNCKEFQEFEPGVSWPGFRSKELSKESPFLFELVMCHLRALNLPFLSRSLRVSLYLHLRTPKEKDWIHVDNVQNNKSGGADYAGLIYLNNTNYKSGTKIFSDTCDEPINDFKYVQNRLIMYSGSYRHMGYGYFGNNFNNGRTTLNLFITNL